MKTLRHFFQQEDINFLLTNRVPRIALTRFMGWFSKIRSPLLARFSIGLWRLFTDLDLSEAKPQQYASLHDCFTRELRPGARPINTAEELLCSPSDGIVGACGHVNGTQVFQAKGFPYELKELFGPSQDTTPFENGVYITLRLTSAMYHRFHAPHNGVVEHVTYISGDTWNVNPIALKRVEKLFCRNERAVVNMRLKQGGHRIALVPVAAILVASMRLHFANVLLHLRYQGPNEIPCQAPLQKGQEMGWFEHGSTIIVFAPKGFELLPLVVPGARVRMGEGLMRVAGHSGV
jgi:phosphatidylserine decarboxylase